MSSKAFLSSSCTMADSRSSSRPSDLRLHRWPPFLSAAVLSATCRNARSVRGRLRRPLSLRTRDRCKYVSCLACSNLSGDCPLEDPDAAAADRLNCCSCRSSLKRARQDSDMTLLQKLRLIPLLPANTPNLQACPFLDAAGWCMHLT